MTKTLLCFFPTLFMSLSLDHYGWSLEAVWFVYLNAEYSCPHSDCLSSSSRSETLSSIWQQRVSWIGKEIPEKDWQTVPPSGVSWQMITSVPDFYCMVHVNSTYICSVFYISKTTVVCDFSCLFLRLTLPSYNFSIQLNLYIICTTNEIVHASMSSTSSWV